jgi:hypothetical protein
LTQLNLPKNYLTLLAIIGFGIVLAGSGFEGMTPNLSVSFAGIAIIFVDIALWISQKLKAKKLR